MSGLFELIKKYRDETIILGFFIFTFGFYCGNDIMTNVLLKNLILLVFTPFGLLLVLYGYEMIYCKNPLATLKKVTIGVIIMWINFILFINTTEKFLQLILMFVFCISVYFGRKHIINERI